VVRLRLRAGAAPDRRHVRPALAAPLGPGWDAAAGEYRASSADNNGPNLAIYRGRIDGNRLVYESLQDGLPRIRLTWILADPDHCRWRNEITLDGQTWNLIDEYEMVAA
jgi:hypothetical protein